MRFHTSLCSALTAVRLGTSVLLGSVVAAWPADHRIHHIEVLDNKHVTIHFDTLANRTYTLQYRTTLASTNGSTGWTNIYVAPSEPFQNHHVVTDFRTNQFRFYRLRVTP